MLLHCSAFLQCQEQGFSTNNPLSSLPRRSHPRQHSPAQNLAHRQPLPRADPARVLLPGRQHGKRNTLQEQSFHTQLQDLAGAQVSSWTAEPRQASKLHITSHPGKTSRSYTNQTGPSSCSQKHPCLSTAPSSSSFPLSQTRSRV